MAPASPPALRPHAAIAQKTPVPSAAAAAAREIRHFPRSSVLFSEITSARHILPPHVFSAPAANVARLVHFRLQPHQGRPLTDSARSSAAPLLKINPLLFRQRLSPAPRQPPRARSMFLAQSNLNHPAPSPPANLRPAASSDPAPKPQSTSTVKRAQDSPDTPPSVFTGFRRAPSLRVSQSLPRLPGKPPASAKASANVCA